MRLYYLGRRHQARTTSLETRVPNQNRTPNIKNQSKSDTFHFSNENMQKKSFDYSKQIGQKYLRILENLILVLQIGSF